MLLLFGIFCTVQPCNVESDVNQDIDWCIALGLYLMVLFSIIVLGPATNDRGLDSVYDPLELKYHYLLPLQFNIFFTNDIYNFTL